MSAPAADVPCAVTPPESKASTTRTRVPLLPSESAEADAVAASEGLGRGPWIAKVVRMVLADVAEPSPAEMRALVQAAAEMRALVATLARLSRAIERSTAGESGAEDAPDTRALAALVARLETRLAEHTETTARALRASHERWGIERVRNQGRR